MIADSPRTLLLLLGVLTVLGAVIGYCLALIFVKRTARKVIETSRLELTQERRAVESDLQAARDSISKLRSSAHGESGDDRSSTDREKALESHTQSQAQRIQDLEAQLASEEDKQLRLRRDFASYKSNKSRELELAKNSVGQWADTANLPTLSRKVDSVSGRPQSGPLSERVALDTSLRNRDELSFPLSREIDIPALAESELPDSVDELDFDVSGAPGSGEKVGG